MAPTAFFRLLKTPIDEKGEALASEIITLNRAAAREETFIVSPADFALVPGSPFAYWIGRNIRQLFTKLPSLLDTGASVQHGVSSKHDFRFLRLCWEVQLGDIGRGLRWAMFAKGGAYSPFYSDVHLLINWQNDAREIHEYLVERYPYLNGNTSWILHPENTYFSPGLTWPRRTSGFSVRILPKGSIFADKGPAVFVPQDDELLLMALLAVLNSSPFETLVRVQLARTELAQSYEVGLIQTTPIPPFGSSTAREVLATLATKAHDLQRGFDRTDETTHAFCLPGLVHLRSASLLKTSLALEAEAQTVQARLCEIRIEIDDLVFDLYGFSEADRALVRSEMGQPSDTEAESSLVNCHPSPDEADEEEEVVSPPEDLPARVQNLLMWCVGVTFGRWDVRMALDPTLLPALQGPFDPLPRCAPGALVGIDGLPPATAAEIAPEAWLRARQSVLDLPGIDDLRLSIDDCGPDEEASGNRKSSIVNPKSSIAWDGILVDDPTHPSDIVSRVQGVLTLLWGERAGDIEQEACEILGYKTLRDYFRDPRRGFFAFHIKRYSKSRRKAPIYWLLQSERRNYAIWLYYHRMDKNTLYAAGRNYADAKVALEETRLVDLRQGLDALSGSARKRGEVQIEKQQKLVEEVTAFRNRLDAVALRNLPPDLNDGVVISIAPLQELVPWKEAQRTWERLLAGEYPWSTMAKQMRQRGLVGDEEGANKPTV